MFEKANLEIYELDLTDIIVTSDPFSDLEEDDIVLPRRQNKRN